MSKPKDKDRGCINGYGKVNSIKVASRHRPRRMLLLEIVLFVGFFCILPWGMNGTYAEDNLPDIDDVSSERSDSEDDEMAVLERVIEEEESRELGEESRGVQSEGGKAFGGTVDVVDGDKSSPQAEGDAVVDNDVLGLPSDKELNGESVGSDSPVKTTSNQKIAMEPEPDFSDTDLPETALPSDSELGDLPAEDFAEQGRGEDRSLALDPGAQNEIHNLEFKMEGTGSRIVVSSRHPLRYREIKNSQMKQVVYFFENTVAPEKVQRAYDTTEFQSPVALFTLLQVPNETPPVSKLIVQLREEQDPSVVPTERGLFIDFGAPTKSSEARIVYGKDQGEFSGEENIYQTDRKFTGRIISRLEIKDSDVQDVLRLIARTSGYNIVVGDDVKGKVGTLSLENVPWDQAFTLILQTKKLGYVRQGNVIRVAQLRTLQTEKSEAVANEKAKMKAEPLRTILVPVSYAQAKDLAKKGKSFLTDRGTIDTDERTNTIIVKDVRKTIGQVQKLFSALDTQPPRVSIGAKFVEMTSTFARNLGVHLGFSNIGLGGLNIESLDWNYLNTASGNTNFRVSAPSLGNLNAQLSIGETENKVKTLANPTVSVVANQSATVTRSQSRFCQTIQISSGGVATPVFQRITATLTLSVTPIVAGDGTIFLTINIVNEIPVGSCENLTVDSRNVDTQVLLENGDTAVVGSIFTSDITELGEYFPLLGRIPVLGFLFSAEAFTDQKSEIFVFVTAKIMNAEESFKRTM